MNGRRVTIASIRPRRSISQMLKCTRPLKKVYEFESLAWKACDDLEPVSLVPYQCECDAWHLRECDPNKADALRAQFYDKTQESMTFGAFLERN